MRNFAVWFYSCILFWQGFTVFALASSLVQQPHHSRSPPFPVGARYEKAIKIPFLGHQRFSFVVLSETSAQLLVEGMLFIDEVVTYSINARGHLICQLPETALRRLNRVRASLHEIGYDNDTDTPYVKVNTPLPGLLKIQFQRKEKDMDITGDVMMDPSEDDFAAENEKTKL